MGRRTSKQVGGAAETAFLYDGVNVAQETQNATINPILVGLGVDERFARNDVSGRTYFLTDALNSTIGLTNSSGAWVQQYQYDPYGNLASAAAANNPYQYTGRENDGNGLYYYRARYYSEAMGRFISEDPIGNVGGANGYGYAWNSPTSLRDPSGNCPFCFAILGGAINLTTQLFENGDNLACVNWGEVGKASVLGLAGGFAGEYLELLINNFTLLDVLGSDIRGISDLGGVFTSDVNEAGGTVWTSVGNISQADFRSIVNSALYEGDVNIMTGVHGMPDGSTIAEPSFLEEDVERFGNVPNVRIYNFPDMTPDQISNLMRGKGTTIGAFCNSAACLAPYK